MALSRPLLLALLGVALLAATVFAVQNARTTSGAESVRVADQAPAEQAAPAPTPASSGNSEPLALIESAFSADVESASFEGELSFRSRGETNSVKTSGSFVDNGAREMPEVDIQVSARVESVGLNLSGGFVTTGDRAWFTRGRSAYAVPQATWSQIVKARKSGAESTAPDTSDLELDPSGWLRDVKSEGEERVGGVETTHFSAEVDSAKAITEVVRAMSQAGQGSSPLPGAERRLRQSGLTDGKLDVWVGEDKILRRVTLGLSGRGDGGRRVNAQLSFGLSDVNQPQEIGRPANVKAGLPDGMYGQVANGLIASLGESVGLGAEQLRIGVPVTNSHVKAERAVADNRKVVILFYNPKGLDDRAVARSVRVLDRRKKNVVVLRDVVENADQYGAMVEDLGVNQAPAIVIIPRSGEASLIEGYIDAASLVQVVADAR